MDDQTWTIGTNMEHADIAGTSLRPSRVGLGTWAIGGWMWGGTDEAAAIATIHAAFEYGINLLDTAPVYGFGRSEEIVGKAIAKAGLRSRAVIATKVGLDWKDGKPFRNASRARINQEVEDSLRRLQTDHIDIYQVHWPDPKVSMSETADAMRTLFDQGKIRAIGVSNFSIAQIDEFRRAAPLHVVHRLCACVRTGRLAHAHRPRTLHRRDRSHTQRPRAGHPACHLLLLGLLQHHLPRQRGAAS
jgi:aryl-alcohol dehydrogenase-like predicted oxidoreductase